jgi:predicted RNase H-like HicB family nuclease
VQKLRPHDRTTLVGRSVLDEDMKEQPWVHQRPNARESILAQAREILKLYVRSGVTLYSLYEENRRLRMKLATMETELRSLTNQHTAAAMTPGERVYAKLRPELEGLRGKYVAIDTENQKVVGVGNTLEEARNEAIQKTHKRQFYFRRVGQKSLFRF